MAANVPYSNPKTMRGGPAFRCTQPTTEFTVLRRVGAPLCRVASLSPQLPGVIPCRAVKGAVAMAGRNPLSSSSH
jgi:hypothetical protein